MATTYRAHILSSEAAANGDIHLDMFVQRSAVVDGQTVWQDVQTGHRTLVLNGREVLDLTGTAAQKRAGLLALFKAEVAGWGLDKSDSADMALKALVPSFPVDVPL
jgi:hypothetical protein